MSRWLVGNYFALPRTTGLRMRCEIFHYIYGFDREIFSNNSAMWHGRIAYKNAILSARSKYEAVFNPAIKKISSFEQSPLKNLDRGGGSSLAYRFTPGKSPGIMFIPGYMSNMNGGKALALEKYSKENGHSFVRFDYQTEDFSINPVKTVQTCIGDCLAVFDRLTQGPQYIVGSSMGTCMMLLLALERPERIVGLIGVAAFTAFPKHNQIADTLMQAEDLMKYQSMLLGDSINITCPVRLIHGMDDDTVPSESSLDIARRLKSNDVDVILRKCGKHRMSTDRDLDLLIQTLDQLIRHSAKL
ncbi:palmitoyl-protein thioesterase ABHD10, mitochondrial-like [Saccoglossus kowalevskii]|uniref:Mycophenolic acid acyl-glucuronide esterase, mitochondrial-like n=1 Tax=Saccoglossus kowalevskii TaxID=10224 RepID=A0ABM0LWP7_SACKO|nr:PREDICTED: mycophenolic acid acyl-glucuronide esterase, mitochondrial-like [Saccoglossus kowalevskii]